METFKFNSDFYSPTPFNKFIDQFINEGYSGGRTAQEFTPKVDIAESDKSFEIQMQLPGIPKEHIDIIIERDQVIISGERNIEKNEEGKKFKSIESHFGAFRRSFTLPENINKDEIKANHTQGILIIEIPKDMEKMIKKSIAIS